MGAGVLRDVSLAYQLLWDTNRQVTGVRLCLGPHTNSTFDTDHLIGTLGELWPSSSGPLLLATPSLATRQALLALTPVGLARIEVPDISLQDTAFAQHAMKAARRGLTWCGAVNPAPASKPQTQLTLHKVCWALAQKRR